MSTTEERVVLSVEARDELTAPLQDMGRTVERTATNVTRASQRQADTVGRAMQQISGATNGAMRSTERMQRVFDQTTGSMSSTAGRAGREIDRALNSTVGQAMTNVMSTIRRSATGISAAAGTAFRGINERLREATEQAERQSQDSGKHTGSAFAMGFKGAMGGLSAAVAAVGFGQLISEATRASDATDKFIATMGFAGLDTSAIDKAKKAAQDYADQTVYDLPTIQNMLAQLASNGVKDYTGLTKAAGNLNAVAGGNAETFKSVAMVMTQTAGAGKLTTENWNQLADAIPGAAGPLMKALEKAGAYTGNFRDAMSKGEITADEFNAALMELGTKPVAVEAAKSTKTFEGAIGNLQATINGGLMKAMDAIKPAATTAITALSNGLGAAIAWTEKAAKGLYDLFVRGDFTAAFREAFNVEEDSPLVDLMFNIRDGAIGLYDLIIKGDYQGMLRKAFGWEEDSAAVDMILGLRDAAMKLPDVLKDLASKGADVVQWLWDMREPIGIIAGLILTIMIPRLIQLGIEALKSAAMQKLAWMITQGAAARAAVVNTFAVWGMIGGWVLLGAQALIQGAKVAAGWLLAMGPIGWAIGIIALLVGAFVWAYNNVEWFRDGVDAAMKWVGEAVQNVGKWISDVWNGVVDWWNSYLMPAVFAVGKWFSDAWGGIVSWWNGTLMPAIQAVGKWFSDVFTNIGNWLRDFVGFFVDGWGMLVDFYNGVLFPAIKAVGDFFAGVFDWVRRLAWNFMTIMVFLWLKLVDFWNGVLFPAIKAVGDFFKSVFDWIWLNAVKPALDWIVGGFNWLGTMLNAVFTWIYTAIIKPAVDFWVSAFHAVIDWWNNTLVPAFQAVGQWFSDIFAWIYNNIIVPYVNFWISVFRSIVDWWNGTFLPALQAVGQWFSDVFTWIYENIIKPVVDGIVNAFNGIVDWWNNTLLPAAQAVGKWFSDIIGGAISGVQDFIGDLIDGFNGFVKFWSDTLKPVVDGIAGIFNDIGDAIDFALGKLGEFANNPLGGIQDWLGIKKDENGQGIMPTPGASGGMVAGYSGGGVVKMAGGGIIPGYAPGVDDVPAILSRGESVLVPELTRAIGPSNIMALNAEYSGGRPAGSGPSPALASAVSGRGGSTLTIERGAVNIGLTVAEGGTVTETDMEAIKEAVEEVFREIERRGY